MVEAAFPHNENARIDFIKSLNILDTPAEERFNRITRIACQLLNVPISLVSIVDQKRQWFKSSEGLSVSETPREYAFCAHAIHGDMPLIVEDATRDSRFCDNPLVTGTPNIRFYAGFPLTFAGDIRIGTLCAIGTEPRTLTPHEIRIMADLRAMVEAEMKSVLLSQTTLELIQENSESERAVLIDPITRLWNKDGVSQLLWREMDFAARNNNKTGLALVDIDNFARFAQDKDPLAGHAPLQFTAKKLLSSLRPYDIIGRWQDDAFMLILPNTDGEAMAGLLAHIKNSFKMIPLYCDDRFDYLTLSIGATIIQPDITLPIEDRLTDVTDNLRKAQKLGGNQRVIT